MDWTDAEAIAESIELDREALRRPASQEERQLADIAYNNEQTDEREN